MYVNVIPRQKMPRGKRSFTYESKAPLTRGAIVRISFRGNNTWGVVESIEKNKPSFKTALIETALTDITLSPAGLELIAWFSEYYRVSYPTTLHTIMPEFTQTIPEHTQSASERRALKIPASTIPKLRKAVGDALQGTSTVYRAGDRSQTLAFYYGCLNQALGHTLILCPDDEAVDEIASALIPFSPKTYKSTLSNGQQTACWKAAKNGGVWVTTKLGAFLPFQKIYTIIIDQEQSTSHKQFDLNPRYDARDIAAFLAKKHQAKQIFTSPTPRIQTRYEAAQYIDQIPKQQRGIIVGLGQKGLITPELTKRIQDKSRVLILFNRKGWAKYHVCATCSYTFDREKTICPNCKGTNAYLAGLGIEELQQRFRQAFPDKTLALFDADHPEAPTEQLLLATTYALSHTDISNFDSVVCLLADQFLNTPSYTAQEQAFHLLSELARNTQELLVQTYQPNHPVILSALSQDYDAFYTQEIAQRKLLGYPPFGTIVKIIDKKTQTERFEKENPAKIPLNTNEIIDINPE